MKELIEQIAKALVDNPDQVSEKPIEGEQTTVLELRVAPNDLGKVIGKQEMTQALRRADASLTLNAVEVYVSRLRSKLEGSEARIRTIHGFGYMLESRSSGAHASQ